MIHETDGTDDSLMPYFVLLFNADCLEKSGEEECWSTNSSSTNNMALSSHGHQHTAREGHPPALPRPSGHTPYTLSVNFSKQSRGFGFSVTWTRPPRVERVEAGLPASEAGLMPGDYIIFVGQKNIVKMTEKEVMDTIR